MNTMSKTWYLKLNDHCYGPEPLETLIQWAESGRIVSGHQISQDREHWVSVDEVPELGINWLILLPDQRTLGPYHRRAAEELLASKSAPQGAKIIQREVPESTPPPPAKESQESPVEEAMAAPEASVPQQEELDLLQEESQPERIYVPDEPLAEEVTTSKEAHRLQQQLEQANLSCETLTQEVANLRASLEQVQQQLVAEKQSNAELQTRLARTEEQATAQQELQETLEKLQADLSQQKLANDELKDSLNHAQEVTTSQQERLLALEQIQSNLSTQEQANSELQTRLAESEARCADLQEQLTTIPKLQEELSGQVKRFDEQAKVLTSTQEELATLRQEHSEVLQASNTRDLELQENIQTLQQQLTELQSPEQIAKVADQRDFTKTHELISEELRSLEDALDAERTYTTRLRETSTSRQEKLQERIFALRKLLGSDSEEFRRNALHRTNAANTALIMAEVNTYKANCQQEIKNLIEVRDEQSRQIQLLKAEEQRLKTQLAESARQTVDYEQIKEDFTRVSGQLEQERRIRISDQEQFNAIQNSLLQRIDELENANPFLNTERRIVEDTRAGFRAPNWSPQQTTPLTARPTPHSDEK